jgi:NAD(P)-dependent dehydrogenase (short-subunit alcohol dehydrogenase family)
MKLSGRVAIVTGSGSRIRRGIAQRFATEGASVVNADVKPSACAHVSKDAFDYPVMVVKAEFGLSRPVISPNDD